jgi:hypothetical protein
MKFKSIFYLGCLSFIILFCAGCKINYTMSGASISPDIKTVTVNTFQNFAALAPPTLSLTFTESVRNIVTSQTRLKMVQKSGDVQIEGKITGYNTSPVAVQSGGNTGQNTAALTRLTITVNVKFTNTIDEKQNFEQAFTQFADFSASSTLSQEEPRLIKDITERISQDIFNRCFSNW